MIEIPFESQTDYDRTGADRICMDVTFSSKGDLDIYKHGFIQAEAGCRYMTYADGTPFFYLGDTHWGMYREEIDEPGPNAGETGAASHFRYIVDRRAEQGKVRSFIPLSRQAR